MDNYKRIRVLGKGGFGSAILVEKRHGGGGGSQQQLVLKEVLLQPGAGHAKAIEDAKREASFLKSLHHPNIVSFIDSFAENGNLYIVMEFADGGDLHQRITQLKTQQRGGGGGGGGGGGMPEEEALNYFVQICLAIKHVHDRKILHRDLKSQNVFLTKKGIVKVGDFGIAKSLSSSMDMAKTQIGTPYYLSPEICCDKPYNKKSDMWALGVVLYEMLALSLPFLANDLPRLVTKILAGKYAPLSPQYSRATRALVESLLQKDPKQRPSINSVLRTDVVRSRMQGFLTQTLAAREFGEALKLAAPMPPHGEAVKVQHAAAAAAAAGGGGGGIVNVVSRQPIQEKQLPLLNEVPPPPPFNVFQGPGNVVQAAAAVERERILKAEREKAEKEKASADRIKIALIEKERAAKALSEERERAAKAAADAQQQRIIAAAAAARSAAEEQHRRKLREAVERERALQREREKREALAIAAARRDAEVKRAKASEHAEQSEAAAALEKVKRREHAKIAREKWVEARKKEWENNSSSNADVVHDAGSGGEFVVMISPDPHEKKQHVRSLSAANEAEQAKHEAYLLRLEEARKAAFADRQAAAERARQDRVTAAAASGGSLGGPGGEVIAARESASSSSSSPPHSYRDRARSRSESSDNTDENGAASFVKAIAKERRAAELRAHDEALRSAARQSFEEKKVLQEAKIERERIEREMKQEKERETGTIHDKAQVESDVDGHSRAEQRMNDKGEKQKARGDNDHEAALASARIAAFQERKLLEQRREEALAEAAVKREVRVQDESIMRPRESSDEAAIPSIRSAPVAMMVYIDADGKEGEQPQALRPKPALRLGKDRQRDPPSQAAIISSTQPQSSQGQAQDVLSNARPPKPALRHDAPQTIHKKAQIPSSSMNSTVSVKEGPTNLQSGASSARAVEVLRAIDRARNAADAVRGSYPPFLAPKLGAARSASSTPASSSLPVPSSSSLGMSENAPARSGEPSASGSSPPKPVSNLYREMNQEKKLQLAVQKRLGLKAASSSKQFVSALQNQHKRGIPSDKSILFALQREGRREENEEEEEVEENDERIKGDKEDLVQGNKDKGGSTSTPGGSTSTPPSSFDIYEDVRGAVRQLENFESMEGRTIGVTVEETFFSALMNAPSVEESSSYGRLDEDQTLINALLGGIAPPSLSARDTVEVSLEEDEWSAADKDAVNHEVAVAGLQDDILLALAIGESTIEEEEEEEEEEDDKEGRGSDMPSAEAIEAALLAAESYGDDGDSDDEDVDVEEEETIIVEPKPIESARSTVLSASSSLAASLLLSTTLLPSQLKAAAATSASSTNFFSSAKSASVEDSEEDDFRPLMLKR